MHNNIKILTLTLMLSTTSCSTLKDSATIGVISGAVAGGAGGKAFSHTDRDKKAQIAAASGAILGGIASYIIHNSLQKRDANVRKKTLFNLENFGVSQPVSGEESSQNFFFPKQDYLKNHKKGVR